jgi:hypothetical protein
MIQDYHKEYHDKKLLVQDAAVETLRGRKYLSKRRVPAKDFLEVRSYWREMRRRRERLSQVHYQFLFSKLALSLS